MAGVLLPFLAFHLYGVRVWKVWGTVHVATWDVAVVLVLGLWLGGKPWRDLQRFRRLAPVLYLFVGMLVWFGIAALRSPLPVKGATMWIMLVRDMALFLVTVDLIQQLADRQSVYRFLFYLGSGLALLALVLFFVAVAHRDALPGRLPLGGTVIIYSERFHGYTIPRLIGFARDPNFFALFLVPALFAGWYTRGLSRMERWTGSALMGLALLFTQSRTVLAFLPVAAGVTGLLIRPQLRWNLSRRGILRGVLVVSGAAAVLVVLRVLGVPLVDELAFRFRNLVRVHRLRLWSELLYDSGPLLWGRGLRSAQVVLGRYAHNSYLDLFYETGVVGLTLWLTFALATVRHGRDRVRVDRGVVPWLVLWVLVLMMFFAFSLLYNPFPWWAAAFLWASREPARAD